MHPVFTVAWPALCAICTGYALVSAVISAVQGSFGWALIYALAAAWSAFEGLDWLLRDEVE